MFTPCDGDPQRQCQLNGSKLVLQFALFAFWVKLILFHLQRWISSTKSICSMGPSQSFAQRPAVRSCLLDQGKKFMAVYSCNLCVGEVDGCSGHSSVSRKTKKGNQMCLDSVGAQHHAPVESLTCMRSDVVH